MFEVNAQYENRKGRYTVLAIMPPKMKVQYEDDETAVLNMEIQYRIWLNIKADQESQPTKIEANDLGRSQFFIYTVAADEPHQLREEDRLGSFSDQFAELGIGARIIYYDVEGRYFYSVLTITGPELADHEPIPVKDQPKYRQYPIEIETYTKDSGQGLSVSGLEIESLPGFKKLLQKATQFYLINEDDFESLSESLAEISEELEGDDLDLDTDDDSDLD